MVAIYILYLFLYLQVATFLSYRIDANTTADSIDMVLSGQCCQDRKFFGDITLADYYDIYKKNQIIHPDKSFYTPG